MYRTEIFVYRYTPTDYARYWFTSHLPSRTEHVTIGKARSLTYNVTRGVPQGLVLGPTLFTLNMIPPGHIISRHGISFHCYADDRQLYISIKPSPSTPLPLSTLTSCLEEIEVWMKLNFLQLNISKTEVIQFGTPHQVQSSTITSITFSSQNTPLSTSVINLGVRMDPHLTFETHIKHLCKMSFFHLRNITKLRPMLTLADAEKLIHAFVSSSLDYCNALLIGIPSYSLQWLQCIQNNAAKILIRVRKHDPSPPSLSLFTGSPSHSELSSRFPSSPTSAYKDMPPLLPQETPYPSDQYTQPPLLHCTLPQTPQV
ncbi:uncharacterized protein LOC126384199 [Epinephelus moara]|uniref:uncharacterized protein LOC126384199 n=1 Tax=Epinephelus moara TaxID=300413 RepID=UPI00214EDE88|nr:uncharacterized protein LOC126384199 [Epinephelus moara]XP_049891113.1 uncharacterized protein LOC126384199 [Epinephelus moara]XP_049891114.1 uncharacterized protein LOC126384199 [Epinephelus moara]XP_049891116.1 uncharacterized protein LOC126384199 [Epinephelus moara]XP_049891117.1 uncharacterized protein LOC126384199 [Epinephelus moara]XP_049891118.1 uncharacterized protein LOC126384199 [Epinephelus moara]